MTTREPVNILLVDDQPGKLLSLRTILADMGENIIEASSGDEALKHLLTREVAVILVDVCMPNLDGFELAELIRGHPRFRRTAIIFISAVALTDADRIKAYGLGAVDYIPVPIVPELLKAKVSVFAELYRKTDQLHRMNRELEERVAERTSNLQASNTRLRESELRYRQLVHGLPAAVYTCDAQGKIVLYNDAAVALWGRTPEIGKDDWHGSWKAFNPDGSPVDLDQSPMAIALREGRAVRGQEMIVQRPDGTRRTVVPFPKPIYDDAGALIGAVDMLVDVTERKAAERAQALLASVVACSDDAIISNTLDGQITSWNAGAERIFGFAPDEVLGKPILMMVEPERRDEHAKIHERLGLGERVDTFETVWMTKDDRPVDVSVTVSLLTDSQGSVFGAATFVRDITARKKWEAMLARDRETLERMVVERTAELERSNEHLRFTDRMAMIGTLVAGIGHDIGNLLLPIRMRLDTLQASGLSPAAQEDTTAIRRSIEYLQRLAGNLRLLAIDPQSTVNDHQAKTELHGWWSETEGIIRNAVRRSVSVSTSIPEGLSVAIDKASLTQIVFNLVQNAGDALHARESGRVMVSAGLESDNHNVVWLSVADNGPGMSDEAKRRCLEPFFTTKPREVGTGLGLSLVAGLLKRAGGTIRIESTPTTGTVVRLQFRSMSEAETQAVNQPVAEVAVVTLQADRLSAQVRSMLDVLGYDVRHGAHDQADVWITEASREGSLNAAREFLASRPNTRVLLIGSPLSHEAIPERLVYLEADVKPSALRTRLRDLLASPFAQAGKV